MLARKHMPSTRSPMAGRRAGNKATNAINGAKRAIDAATEALMEAPTTDHRRDGLAALKRTKADLIEALACAEYLKKGQ